MTETVAEALSRHEADCPVCKANYAPHCGERETVEELAELRVALASAEADRDRYRDRVAEVERRSAATPVDVEIADEGDAIMRDFDEVAQLDPASILKVVDLARQAFLNAIANFNACARLEAEVRDLTEERDRYLTRAVVAEAKVEKVLKLADSYVAKPCHSGCGRPDYPGCTCNAGDFRKAGKAILTAIGGKP